MQAPARLLGQVKVGAEPHKHGNGVPFPHPLTPSTAKSWTRQSHAVAAGCCCREVGVGEGWSPQVTQTPQVAGHGLRWGQVHAAVVSLPLCPSLLTSAASSCSPKLPVPAFDCARTGGGGKGAPVSHGPWLGWLGVGAGWVHVAGGLSPPFHPNLLTTAARSQTFPLEPPCPGSGTWQGKDSCWNKEPSSFSPTAPWPGEKPHFTSAWPGCCPQLASGRRWGWDQMLSLTQISDCQGGGATPVISTANKLEAGAQPVPTPPPMVAVTLQVNPRWHLGQVFNKLL